MNNSTLVKYFFTYGAILTLSLASISYQSDVTTSSFSDEASISSSFTTAAISAAYSGQDTSYYRWNSTDKLDFVRLETSSADDPWKPGRGPITKTMEISNNGDMDFFYTLRIPKDEIWPGSLSQGLHLQAFIEGELVYEGIFAELSTEKHRLNINQTNELKFVLTMPSTDRDNQWSEGSMSERISVDTFVGPEDQRRSSYAPYIEIGGDSSVWRERIFRISSESSTSVRLESVRVKNANRSIIEYSTNVDFVNATSISWIHEYEADFYTHIVYGLNPGTTYYFRTRIDNPEFGSGISDVVTVTTSN